MRDIKFKVWDTKNKKMITSAIKFEMEALNADVVAENDDIGFNGYGDRFEVLQYTGLKDNTGKEIFEGDIIQFDPTEWGDNETNIHEVTWDENRCLWEWVGGNSDDMEWRTVIGNRYENPELLGKVGV